MVFLKKLYPLDWKTISAAIRGRGGNACERCGVKNHAVGARDQRGDWHDEAEMDGMNSDVGMSLFGADSFPRIIRIVLTTAHLPEATGTMDCRPDVLQSLCQMCHNRLDAPQRARNAAATRAMKKRSIGQLPMFAKSVGGDSV